MYDYIREKCLHSRANYIWKIEGPFEKPWILDNYVLCLTSKQTDHGFADGPVPFYDTHAVVINFTFGARVVVFFLVCRSGSSFSVIKDNVLKLNKLLPFHFKT